ncbi:MAG: hypothetical protein OQL06_11555 [Gammaproteobacteria bacterium]|nr:hypothetical protein [Gammaproteobacteria bacterium]
MCSTPRGGRSKPLSNSQIDSTFGDMSSDEYSDMVKRANESYERRQAELRKNQKS